MDADQNPEPRKRRSKTITALAVAIEAAFAAVLHIHQKGESERAMRRLLVMERVLVNALSILQGFKRKLAEDLAPSNDAVIDAFNQQLAELPEVPEPGHG